MDTSTIEIRDENVETPTIQIYDENHRTLLVLDCRDGKLTAKYDAADLDEAAQIFVREIIKIGSSFEIQFNEGDTNG